MNLIAFPAIKIADEGVSRFDLIVMKMDENGLNISLHDGLEIVKGENPKIFYTTRKTIRDGIKSGKLTIIDIKPFMRIGEYYAVAANECKWIFLDKPTENIDEAFENAISKYQMDFSPVRKPDCARIWKEEGLYRIVIPMYTAKMDEVERWIKEYTETMIFEVLARLM
jgi:hypothetical protein